MFAEVFEFVVAGVATSCESQKKVLSQMCEYINLAGKCTVECGGKLIFAWAQLRIKHRKLNKTNNIGGTR